MTAECLHGQNVHISNTPACPFANFLQDLRSIRTCPAIFYGMEVVLWIFQRPNGRENANTDHYVRLLSERASKYEPNSKQIVDLTAAEYLWEFPKGYCTIKSFRSLSWFINILWIYFVLVLLPVSVYGTQVPGTWKLCWLVFSRSWLSGRRKFGCCNWASCHFSLDAVFAVNHFCLRNEPVITWVSIIFLVFSLDMRPSLWCHKNLVSARSFAFTTSK